MPDRNYNTGDGLTAVDPDKYHSRLPVNVEISAKVPGMLNLHDAAGILELAEWIKAAGIPRQAEFYFEHRNSTGGRFVWTEKR